MAFASAERKAVWKVASKAAVSVVETVARSDAKKVAPKVHEEVER